MSRSNHDKPFYVDIGTSIVAIRCASNHDVIERYDHVRQPYRLKLAEDICDRMNKEAARGRRRGMRDEIQMLDTYFCGYDPEEALVMQCSTCRFFKKKHSHCTLKDSLTNARYKCNEWKFKTNKECADEYKAEINREFAELRAENARLRAALKPVLDIVMDSATSDLSMEMAITEAKRIYNENKESDVK